MSTCPKCKTNLTCGCQKRTAKDGTQCCKSCVKAYDQSKATTLEPTAK